MEFEAEIERRGINPFVLVSAERAHAIMPGWKKPMPVLVRVNGKPERAWRVNMMPAGDGSFFLYLDGIVRKQAGVDVGSAVTVSVAFDADYRGGPQHDMLPAFSAGLEQNPKARARWEALTPSLQKEVLRYLARLKSDAARIRNVELALSVLGGAKGRFMARDWN